MEHTATPWSLLQARTLINIKGSSGEQIAQVRVRDRDLAIYLVKAVNSHEALVEALTRQIGNIERWRETGISAGPEESKSIYDQMKAALKLAEGEE